MFQVAQFVGAAASVAAPAHSQNASVRAWVCTPGGQDLAQRNSIAPVAVQKVLPTPSPAIAVMRERFASLRALSDGWDGAHSVAPSLSLLGVAGRILNAAMAQRKAVEAPMIVPVADGGIQAEWYSDQYRFEMYFDADGEISTWSSDRRTGVEMEEDGLAAIQHLTDWVAAREVDHLYHV